MRNVILAIAAVAAFPAAAAEHATVEAAFAAAAQSGRPVVVWAFEMTPEERTAVLKTPWGQPEIQELIRKEFEYASLKTADHIPLCQHLVIGSQAGAILGSRGGWMGNVFLGVGSDVATVRASLLDRIPAARADDAEYAERVKAFLEGRDPLAGPESPAGKDVPPEDEEGGLGSALLTRPAGRGARTDPALLIRECVDRFQLADARTVADKAVERGTLSRTAANLAMARGLCNTERFAEAQETLSGILKDRKLDAETRGEATLWLAKTLFFKAGNDPAFDLLDRYAADKKNPETWRKKAFDLRKALSGPMARDLGIVHIAGR